MHYPGDVDADQPHAGYRMPDEDDVLWPDSGYGDPDGGGDSGFALAGSHYGAAGSFARKGPARGFPPAPGQPPPVYPPGQFAAWNLPPDATGSVAAAWPGAASAEHGYGWPAAKGPGGAAYPPPVDVPSIQPWPADDDATGSASSWPGLAAPVTPAPAAAGTAAAGTAAPAGATRAGPTVPAARSTADTTTAPAAGGPPRSAPRGKRGRRRGGRIRLLAAVGAVLVIAAAAVIYVLESGHHHATPSAGPSPSPSVTQPASPSSSPSPSPSGRWGHIQTRKVDPVPLTLSEVFPAHFTSGGQQYTLTAAKRGKKCDPAVIGAKLQAAVRASACTQVLRGTYLSGDKKIMGTIGVLNTQSARLAQHTGLAAGPHEFILQLKGPKGPTASLGKGTGIEVADVKGHYLILIWAELVSGKKPKNAAQRADLIQFCNRVLAGSANVSLSQRLVNGKTA